MVRSTRLLLGFKMWPHTPSESQNSPLLGAFSAHQRSYRQLDDNESYRHNQPACFSCCWPWYPINLDWLIWISESSLVGWFLQVSPIVIIKERSQDQVSLIVIIKQVSGWLSSDKAPLLSQLFQFCWRFTGPNSGIKITFNDKGVFTDDDDAYRSCEPNVPCQARSLHSCWVGGVENERERESERDTEKTSSVRLRKWNSSNTSVEFEIAYGGVGNDAARASSMDHRVFQPRGCGHTLVVVNVCDTVCAAVFGHISSSMRTH